MSGFVSIFSSKHSGGNPPSWGEVTEFLEARISVTKPAKFQTKLFVEAINLVSILIRIISQISKLLRMKTYHAIASKTFKFTPECQGQDPNVFKIACKGGG